MNISDILMLYDYNFWANRRVLSAGRNLSAEQFVASTDQSHGSLRSTLVHILDTEIAWRWLCKENTIAYFDKLDAKTFSNVEQLQSRWQLEEKSMGEYLRTLRDSDLGTVVRYTLDTGKKRERVLWHCLVHVVNHGTHHRSQAAAIVKHFGHSAGELDLTVFLNDRK